jgi:SpoVK/Ycf46/Vps4 family AAA+-type ATPase
MPDPVACGGVLCCKQILTTMDTVVQSYLFDYGELYAKAVFVKMFKKLPNIITINQLDRDKAYTYIATELKNHIRQELNKTEVSCNDKKEEKEQTIFILRNEVVIDLSGYYCEINYSPKGALLAQQLKDALVGKKKRQKRKPLEINLVTTGQNGMKLSEMEVKRTTLDIGSQYGDDFRDVDQLIRTRLNKKNDKGIVLLHGTPGTGKTTYLRYLIGRIKKKILFLSPEVAANITSPSLIQLLIDNPDSVLIIEDAENILMQRQAGHDSGVSNLLNISDGLLSDCLNIQIICTFNSAISSVDQALLRKGRLIAKYEFGKLPAEKAQALSDKLGFETNVSKAMSLAEIFNQTEKEYAPERSLIGFRTTVMTN